MMQHLDAQLTVICLGSRLWYEALSHICMISVFIAVVASWSPSFRLPKSASTSSARAFAPSGSRGTKEHVLGQMSDKLGAEEKRQTHR